MMYRKIRDSSPEQAFSERTRPRPPPGLTAAERAAFNEILDAGIPLGVLAPSHLPLITRTARAAARSDALMSDPSAKPTAVNSAVRLTADLLTRLRLAPSSSGRDPRPAPAAEGRDPESEFGR